MHDFAKNVLWIFSYSKPEQFPSLILSGVIPADQLNIPRVIFKEDDNPIIFLKKYKPKIIITNKIKHKNLIRLLEVAKNNNIKIITVYDDWSFDKNSIHSQRHQLNFDSINLANLSVVKTSAASEIIYKNTGLIANIIPDCLWFKSEKPIAKVNYPFKASWFGMNTNHTTINEILPSLEALNEKIHLNIITNKFEKLQKVIESNNYVNLQFKFTVWTPEFNYDLLKSDLVIIPYSSDNIRLVKSANRIVDTMNLGRFVIMSNAEQFSEFKDYCYFGNIADGFKWLKVNQDLALKKTISAQEYIINNYSNKITVKKWEKLIKSLL